MLKVINLGESKLYSNKKAIRKMRLMAFDFIFSISALPACLGTAVKPPAVAAPLVWVLFARRFSPSLSQTRFHNNGNLCLRTPNAFLKFPLSYLSLLSL